MLSLLFQILFQLFVVVSQLAGMLAMLLLRLLLAVVTLIRQGVASWRNTAQVRERMAPSPAPLPRAEAPPPATPPSQTTLQGPRRLRPKRPR